MHNPAATSTIEPCSENHPALLTFTSGGTGLPKAAVRTHGFLLAQNRVLSRTLQLTAGEIDLATLPVFVLANIAAGVTTVIPDCDLRYPGSFDTSKVLDQVILEKPISTACSPAFIERLATAALRSDSPLASFRRIYTGGAPVMPWLLDKVAQAAPEAEVIAVYGSTEAEPISELTLSTLTSGDRATTAAGGGLPAGHPVEEIQLRIIQDQWGSPLGKLSVLDFNDLHLPSPQRGEIVVYGDHVLQGYLDGRGNEETKFDVDGTRWHRTGDAGYLDSDGRLWLLGRCQSVLRDDRGTLYPFAVEMVVQQHSAIARVALLHHKGQRVLFIEPVAGSDPPTQEQVLSMVPWASLDTIQFLKQIPVDRRHNAKVDYPRLQQMIN
jgi:acyl-CoA synthetase (AMP-forming)/AMP-acid ligase II